MPPLGPVTPVFSGAYSGLFKTFFDVLDKERRCRGQPALLDATAGTARHSLVVEHALRPLFAYRAGGGPSGPLDERIVRAGELAESVKTRPRRGPRDELADVVPFEQLLHAR